MTASPLLLLVGCAAFSQEISERDELFRHAVATERPFELASWLWSDLGAARRRWDENGFTFEAYLTTDLSSQLSGGVDPGASAFRGLFDAIVTVDGRRIGLPDSRVVVGVQAYGGDNGSAEAGVIQCYSNIDAPDDRVQLARLWYEQSWNDSATQVRVGKMDANGLFAVAPAATPFIHSSMGFSPTILGLPTYPDSAFGVAVGQAASERLLLRVGAYDGEANSGVKTGESGVESAFSGSSEAFFIAQADASWDDGFLALGGWHHSGSFDRFDGGEESGTSGSYLVLEQQLAIGARGRTLAAFLQAGLADEEVSAMSEHVGLGVVAENVLLPARRDVLGLGLSHVGLSDESGAGFTADSETAFELFWALDLAPGLRVKPDLQYIADPGGDQALADAWIFTLRMTASL